MTKHTPGPWEVKSINLDTALLIESKYIYIAKIIKYGNINEININEINNNADRANAQLIATAPELYEELEDALEHICWLCKSINLQNTNCTSCEDMDERRKVLVKAEGKE